MANFTVEEGEGGTYRVTWNLTTADPIGDPVSFPGASDRTVHVFGTFGSGTVSFDGSCEKVWDAANAAPLTDHLGNELSYVQPEIDFVTQVTTHIAPTLVGSTGGDVTVILLCRSTRR